MMKQGLLFQSRLLWDILSEVYNLHYEIISYKGSEIPVFHPKNKLAKKYIQMLHICSMILFQMSIAKMQEKR